jgi:hypothetical protein
MGSGECGGKHLFGSPALYSNPPRCRKSRAADAPGSTCTGEPPLVAFLIAGQARSFLEDEAYLTFDEHVVRPLALPRHHIFLFLKLEYNSSLYQRHLDAATHLLRPAAVRVTIERSNDGRLYADLHRRREARTMLRHANCFWRDTPPHYVLQQAAVWWGTMADAWSLLEQWECSRGPSLHHASHEHHAHYRAGSDGSTTLSRHRQFDAVIFARPDIFYRVAFGPWCAYNLTTTW